MALLQNTGRTPTGEMIAVPVAGVANFTTTPLAANAVWDSGIIKYAGNEAVHFALQADQAGTYTIEYYQGVTKINFTGNPTPYDPTIVTAFQGALSGKGDGFKLIYTNGSVAQTSFYLEIRFGDDIQQTLRSLGVPASSTNMAGTTHAAIEGRENGAGGYKQATVTASGAKNGIDVNVINATSTQPVSGTVAVNNFPVTQAVSVGTLPLPTGASTAAKQDVGNTSLGALTDAAVTDPTQAGSIIALLKGLLQETLSPATSSTFQAISLAANVQQTIAANANRKGAVIFSVSGTILVGCGFTATANNYTYRIVTNGLVEIPELYAGLAISLFSTAASTVNVTLPS